MKVLLKNKAGCFYQTQDSWTSKATEAFDFGSSASAIAFVVERKIDDAEIILSFTDSSYDIRLPLHGPISSPTKGSPKPHEKKWRTHPGAPDKAVPRRQDQTSNSWKNDGASKR